MLYAFVRDLTFGTPFVIVLQVLAVLVGYLSLHCAVLPSTRLRDRPLLASSFFVSVLVILLAQSVRVMLGS